MRVMVVGEEDRTRLGDWRGVVGMIVYVVGKHK